MGYFFLDTVPVIWLCSTVRLNLTLKFQILESLLEFNCFNSDFLSCLITKYIFFHLANFCP